MKLDVYDKKRCRLVCVKFHLNRCRFAVAVAKCLGGSLFWGHSVNVVAGFCAYPPHRSLSFFSFRIHYMDFPDCSLLLLSISVFLLFSSSCFYTFLVVGSVR